MRRAAARGAEEPALNCIPTFYRGIRFRSRLEARWAVFFDSLEIDARYEPEAFDFGDDRYLVDFHLPQFGYYVEIKPYAPSEAEIGKCVRLAAAVPDRVRLLYGVIGWWRWKDWRAGSANGGIGFWRERDGEGWIGQADETVALYCPCVCPVCGAFGIEYQGRASRLACGHVTDDKARTGDDKRIAVACETAATWQPHLDASPGLAVDVRGA